MKNQNKFNIFFALLAFLLFSKPLTAQYENHYFSIAGYYNHTITSSLYANPRHTDEWVREFYQSIDYQPSYSFDLRFKISESVIIGIGAEYMTTSSVLNSVNGISHTGPNTIEGLDSYEMFPIELMVYYYLPFSSDKVKFFMGGGVGAYTGNVNRKIGDIGTTTVDREIDYGINVVIGADYMVTPYLAIRGQMKFRDPDFEVKSEYDAESTTIDDEVILLRNSSFYSRVNVDGIIFTIGAAFFFNIP